MWRALGNNNLFDTKFHRFHVFISSSIQLKAFFATAAAALHSTYAAS